MGISLDDEDGFDEAAWRKMYLGDEDPDVGKNKPGKTGMGTCTECGEEKRIIGRGMCMRCYQRARRAGELGNYRPATLKNAETRRSTSVSLWQFYPDEQRDVLLEFDMVAISYAEWKEFMKYQEARRTETQSGQE